MATIEGSETTMRAFGVNQRVGGAEVNRFRSLEKRLNIDLSPSEKGFRTVK